MKVLDFSDWLMLVNNEMTAIYSKEELDSHCTCPWCRNFYLTVDAQYPNLRYFLSQFGLMIEAPESLLPITNDLVQASYTVEGRILRHGCEPIFIDGVAITPEPEVDCEAFTLQLGLMELPWVLEEDKKDASSPCGIFGFLSN